jgi:oligopeptide transport system substrate-binding protein
MMTTPDDQAAPPPDLTTPPPDHAVPPSDQPDGPEQPTASHDDAPDEPPPPSAEHATLPDRSRARYVLAGVALLLVVALVASAITWNQPVPDLAPVTRPTSDATLRGRPSGVDAVIVGSAPSDWDPAVQSDYGSASTIAQIFEGLTAVDAQGVVQPALAESWRVEDGGHRLVFTLRDGITYSDGTPITAEDVVASWLRLLDPAKPSPLASLLSDVVGANDRLAGRAGEEAVGIHADGREVSVDFRRPSSYFPAIAASPTLAVLAPATIAAFHGADLPTDMVVSGAYRPTSETADGVTLKANPAYWAGEAPLKTILVATDLGGQSVVEAFEAGDIDYGRISDFDAGWIAYDATLGPQLRRHTEQAVDFYGFDTTQPPFDDVRVRQAFGKAVDWRRIVGLTTPDAVPATSLVPPGVPGRSDADAVPGYDPEGARRLLAEAGYPGGKGFPETALVTQGYAWDRPIARQIEDSLGITLRQEAMPFETYFERLESGDGPAFWAMSWVADYPAPQDFLGLLLESGSTNNYGRWSDADYDSAIDAAASTDDAAEQARRYAEAEAIVRDAVPVVPMAYHDGWALGREDLVGTEVSGLGILRFASLDRVAP